MSDRFRCPWIISSFGSIPARQLSWNERSPSDSSRLERSTLWMNSRWARKKRFTKLPSR